jgi:hypothetical protein
VQAKEADEDVDAEREDGREDFTNEREDGRDEVREEGADECKDRGDERPEELTVCVVVVSMMYPRMRK